MSGLKRNICLWCIVVFPAILVSYTLSAQTTIEQSTDYKNNIRLLKIELSALDQSSDLYLERSILLVNNYISMFDYQSAIELCQTNLSYATRNNLTFSEATHLKLLGNVYYHLRQPEKALGYWEKCIKISLKYKYNELLKNSYNNIAAIAIEENNNPTKAEIYLLKAIEFGSKVKQTQSNHLGYQYRLLATVYDLQGNYVKSDSLYEVATSVCKKMNDSLGLAVVLTFHARLNLSRNNLEKAQHLSDESVALARRLNHKEHLQMALSVAKNIYVRLGNYQEAYDMLSEIQLIEIAKNAANLKTEIANAEARYKLKELRHEQNLENIEAKQNNRILLFGVVTALILLFGGLMIALQKRFAKKEKELALKSLKEVHEIAENERSRIAADLHDNMGAYATSMLAQIDVLENDVKSEQTSALRNDAEAIMSTLRETIWVLKLKEIPVQEFIELLERYSTKHLKENLSIGVSFNHSIETNKRLTPTESLNLYRIFQEGIQNIIKHADASEVKINVSVNPDLVIVIEDNGKGFDLQKQSRRSGLSNMAFRAKEVGYHFEIESEIGKGTSLNLKEMEV